MYILFYLTTFIWFFLTKGEEYTIQNASINEIAEKMVNIFGVQLENERIKELKDKMAKINTYVVDNDLVSRLVTNVTCETNLNETNFYSALSEKDHFRYLGANESRNLYLQLKAKMNRDDILKILAVKGDKGKMMKSARRMMKNTIPKGDDDRNIHDVVDKMIGEVPNDDHKVKANESIYWDPQGELEDLKEYHDAKRDGRRIYKGERTNIREWPFMASVHIMGRFWCGGALYWNDLVITSASCLQLLHNNRFFRENPRVLQVRIGSNHSRVGGETIEVLEVYFHPSYDPKTLQNNLAIMRLRRHLAFTYRRIPKIIAISDRPTSIPATSDILVLGWGVTKLSQKLAFEPIFLQKKYLPVYPNTFCKEVYGRKFITEYMFCAGTLTTGEGACDHDAGGPAILAGRLVGIISFGPAVCGFANAPTVFTLIGAYTDWIESVNESMPEYYRGKAPTTSSTKSLVNQYFDTWKPPKKPMKLEEPATKIEPLLIPWTASPGEPIETTPTEFLIPAEVVEPAEPAELTETPVTTTEVTSPTPPPAVLRMDESDGGWSIENRK